MRDYKFRQTEWPRRKGRRKALRTIAAILAIVAVGLLVFAGLQWDPESTLSKDAAAHRASLIIPLAIPSAGSPGEVAVGNNPSSRADREDGIGGD
jgi:hypothetical protein